MLKEVLIEANKSLSRKKHLTPHTCTWKVSRQLSFADVVKGGTGNSKSSALKVWRCRNCDSWDDFAAVIGETKGGTQAGPQLMGQECSVMGVKESVSYSQVHFSDEPRGVDGDNQLESNSSGACLIVSPRMHKF